MQNYNFFSEIAIKFLYNSTVIPYFIIISPKNKNTTPIATYSVVSQD